MLSCSCLSGIDQISLNKGTITNLSRYGLQLGFMRSINTEGALVKQTDPLGIRNCPYRVLKVVFGMSSSEPSIDNSFIRKEPFDKALELQVHHRFQFIWNSTCRCRETLHVLQENTSGSPEIWSWAVSFKMSLSSALIATVALLIIVVIVAVVVVVGIYRSAPTILGQMANPLAIIAPRPGLCSASYSVVVVDSD
ncbi:hypothetical protein Tco_0260240 [Tanacetum coccineum]